MKKVILSLTIILATTTVFSQVKISPGIKTGLNLSTLSNVDNSSAKLGLQGGLFVNIHLASFYELQIETTYSNQGTTFDANRIDNGFDPIIVQEEERFELDYLNLNIANKFFPVKNIGLNFIVGPSIDILVHADDNDNIIPIDFSFFGGIGYEFPFGLGIESRYKQGLIEIREDYYDNYDEDDGNFYNSNTVLNGVFQFGVTYKFDLSK